MEDSARIRFAVRDRRLHARSFADDKFDFGRVCDPQDAPQKMVVGLGLNRCSGFQPFDGRNPERCPLCEIQLAPPSHASCVSEVLGRQKAVFGTIRRNRRAHRFIGLFRPQNAHAALLALPVGMFHPEGLAMAHLLRRGSRFNVGVFRSASDAFGG